MSHGERCAIFDDADDTTIILHVGQTQLSIEVSAGQITFVLIDHTMKRSSTIMEDCDKSDDVRSLFRAMMHAQEAADGGRGT